MANIIECPWCLEKYEEDEASPLDECPNCGEDIHAEREPIEIDYDAPSERERVETLGREDRD